MSLLAKKVTLSHFGLEELFYLLDLSANNASVLSKVTGAYPVNGNRLLFVGSGNKLVMALYNPGLDSFEWSFDYSPSQQFLDPPDSKESTGCYVTDDGFCIGFGGYHLNASEQDVALSFRCAINSPTTIFSDFVYVTRQGNDNSFPFTPGAGIGDFYAFAASNSFFQASGVFFSSSAGIGTNRFFSKSNRVPETNINARKAGISLNRNNKLAFSVEDKIFYANTNVNNGFVFSLRTPTYFSALVIDDNDNLYVGFRRNNKSYIHKFDSSGTLLWKRKYQNADTLQDLKIWSLARTNNANDEVVAAFEWEESQSANNATVYVTINPSDGSLIFGPNVQLLPGRNFDNQNGGIRIPDNTLFDFGFCGFTLIWEGELNEYPPSAANGSDILIAKKERIDRKWCLKIDSQLNGALQFYADNFTSIIHANSNAIPQYKKGNNQIAVTVKRETELTAGEVIFYVNGSKVGDTVTLPAAIIKKLDNFGDLCIAGDDINKTGSKNESVRILNRVLSPSELLTVHTTGELSTGDKWVAKDSSPITLAIETATQNNVYSLLSDLTHKDVDRVHRILAAVTDSGPTSLVFSGANIDWIIGENYLISFDLFLRSSNREITNVQVQLVSGQNTTTIYELNADYVTGEFLRIQAQANNVQADYDLKIVFNSSSRANTLAAFGDVIYLRDVIIKKSPDNYRSDFSFNTDLWIAESGASLHANQSRISNKTNNLELRIISQNNASIKKLFPSNNSNGLNANGSYNVEFEFFIPSTNNEFQKFAIYKNSISETNKVYESVFFTDPDPSGGNLNNDIWKKDTFTLSGLQNGTNSIIIEGLNSQGQAITASSLSDKIYIRAVLVKDRGAVLELKKSGIKQNLWLDESTEKLQAIFPSTGVVFHSKKYGIRKTDDSAPVNLNSIKTNDYGVIAVADSLIAARLPSPDFYFQYANYGSYTFFNPMVIDSIDDEENVTPISSTSLQSMNLANYTTESNLNLQISKTVDFSFSD